MGARAHASIGLSIMASNAPNICDLAGPFANTTIGGGAGLGGGGFVFGENPNGGFFLSFRIGYGVGGGLSFDPNGTSPGYDPCKEHGAINMGIGGYGGANVGLGPLYGGINAEAGINIEKPGGVNPYGDISPTYGLQAESGFKLEAGAAAGVEWTMY